tara:strand:+ start:6384 stop:6842 length:459 start_codon:yes stop_codon:yes gene_type:complete
MARVVADDEINAQQEELSDEELNETSNLIGTTPPRKPSCRKSLCKGLILSTAGILFLLMMIQLWSDYGTYIQTQTFPPKLMSMGSYCRNGTQQASYRPFACDYIEKLICIVEKPSSVYVLSTPHSDHSWTNDQLVVEPHTSPECIDLIVWTI